MKKVKHLVADLLREAMISGPPVNVEVLARSQGIEVTHRAFEDDLSGFLFRQGNRSVIAVNAHHRHTRQRFTVAHELGHFFLHPREGVYVDQGVLRFRDTESSVGTNQDEVEANRFAAELLMPEEFIRGDVDARPWILDDEEALKDLAERYDVSFQALVIRLTRLGYSIMSD